MPLGDSITEAANDPAGLMPSYRRDLWADLQAANYDVDFVGSRAGVYDKSNQPAGEHNPPGSFDKDHEGHWGWRVDEILSGRPASYPGDLTQWAGSHRPDVVLMHLGTNDAIQSQRRIVNQSRARERCR